MAKNLSRQNRAEPTGRQSRASRDRAITENREVTDAERLTMFQNSLFQSALPDLPKIPGYHVCWLTTTNKGDSIQSRMNLGYEPVTAEDIPGWGHATLKTGDYIGCIGVNEMVAFKLPVHLYQMYMKHAHHDEPHREEEKLTDSVDDAKEKASRINKRAKKVFLEEGSAELGEPSPVPDFAADAGDVAGDDYD